MREIVLDTETTGLSFAEGHRIVEIGAVELWNHLPTGKTYHQYINPQRDMPAEAQAVHGISAEFLADKPVFDAIADTFLAFIADAPLVIHNVGFDVPFLNAELALAGRRTIPPSQPVDTLAIARSRFPGAQNSLDALCRRFRIDNSMRDKHGALLDSELLAEVYLELMGGRQPDFVLATGPTRTGPTADTPQRAVGRRPRPLAPRLTEDEKAAHAAFVDGLGEGALWRRYV